MIVNPSFHAAISPYKEHVRAMCEEADVDADAFLRFLVWATDVHVPRWSMDGVRAIAWTNAGGFGGLGPVTSLLSQHVDTKTKVDLLVSGRRAKRPSCGEMTAIQLAQFVGDRLDDRSVLFVSISVDGVSDNTGDQGKLIPAWLKAIDAKQVVMVAPLYHMPRYLTTVGYGCRDAGIRPHFIPMPFGRWEEVQWLGTDVRFADLCFSPDLHKCIGRNMGIDLSSEVQKIRMGWRETCIRTCLDLRPQEAVEYFQIG